MNHNIRFIVLACSVMSCFSNEYELTGRTDVVGSTTLYVNIYQRNEFDHVTPLAFELLDDKDSLIISMKFFAGTDVRNEKVENIQPFIHDSIFYLCYPYPVIHFIEHLDKNEINLSRTDLIDIIKKRDGNLVDKQSL